MNPLRLEPQPRFQKFLQPENILVRLRDEVFSQRPSIAAQFIGERGDFSVVGFGFNEKYRAVFSEHQMVNVAAIRFHVMPHDVTWGKLIKQCANLLFSLCAPDSVFFTGVKFIHCRNDGPVNFTGKEDKQDKPANGENEVGMSKK